jgi:hypothetical protein
MNKQNNQIKEITLATAIKKLSELKKSKKGIIFSAKNYTKKGPRVWNCRFNVLPRDEQGNIKLDGIDTTKNYPNLFKVWEMNSKGYRNLNTDTLVELKISGTTYKVKNKKFAENIQTIKGILTLVN